jgi:signal transduction histidine kinase
MSEQAQTRWEQRVLMLPPSRKDGQMTCELLAAVGIAVHLCTDLREVCREIDCGAAAVLLTEEALLSAEAELLVETLNRQPAWSNFPILVLIHGGAESPLATLAMERLGNSVLLERPVKKIVLVTAVRAATNARMRQYELRNLTNILEQRVAERTAVADERARQLQVLASNLTHAEQRERQRLAQVLHDHLQQLLVAMKLRIAMLAQSHEPELVQSIAQLDSLVDEAIKTTRSLTAELSPPVLHERGLPGALQWLAAWMYEKHGLNVEVMAEEDANPASEELRVLVYGAARELLFNVAKHAKASHARLEACRRAPDGCIRIIVTDDGVGFVPASLPGQDKTTGGFGLFSIRERLATLSGSIQISSSPGCGTSVTIDVPAEESPPSPGSHNPEEQ